MPQHLPRPTLPLKEFFPLFFPSPTLLRFCVMDLLSAHPAAPPSPPPPPPTPLPLGPLSPQLMRRDAPPLKL